MPTGVTLPGERRLEDGARPAAPRPAVRSRRLTRRQREALAGYLFLLPWLVGLVGVTLGPMLASLWLSFTRYDLLSAPQWIGAQNYEQLVHDPLFHEAVKVTLLYVGVSVPLQLCFALFLALVLNRGMRALGLVRAIYYVPSLLGSSV
ncbi:MAG TPA: sugar ABC transporter permease, partial [Acidimicrobiales bacterium]|nr:sugar ABC transporter permease [Acidimicrobiales bacterium]